MLKSLMEKREALMARFAKVEESQIQDAELRSKFRNLKAKQGGFTLLELLVVVAILAAIAGTATIALQDTDARASAAAHVAMMDELNKGVRTFRVLNKNALPTGFDSLVQTSAGDAATDAAPLSVAAIEDITLVALPVAAAGVMQAGGLDSLQYVGTHLDADGTDTALTCAGTDAANPSQEEIIASRGNAVVAGNIFLSPAANGCGYTVSFDEDGEIVGGTAGDTAQVALWSGGYERVMGEAGQDMDAQTAFDATTGVMTVTLDADANTPDPAALLAVGMGPSSTLFNANDLGGMTSVPVYRHVSETEYNRFIALFNVGTLTATGTVTPGDQVSLTAIVDGAGDTKEEELGEWDGTRNTI
ncbi:type II secretion system protein [Neptuniibacter sp. SY11_33]|uniref:type II secretion system protein n=1 Tax=Neptuniibacter sp. SY11_33 TaxID=3398215 RepID=UPI0039F483F3